MGVEGFSFLELVLKKTVVVGSRSRIGTRRVSIKTCSLRICTSGKSRIREGGGRELYFILWLDREREGVG